MERSTTALSRPRIGTASMAPRTPLPSPRGPSSAPPSTKQTWIGSWMASVPGTRTRTTLSGSAEHSPTASSRTTTPSDPTATTVTGRVVPEPPGCAHGGATHPGETTTFRGKIPRELPGRGHGHQLHILVFKHPVEPLRWSKTPITFDRRNHWVHLPRPGAYPLWSA
jgi:hypothetical protein